MTAERELELADRIIALVGDRGEAAASVTHRRHGLTRFANSAVHQHVEEDVTGVSVSIAIDGRVGGASTTRTDDDSLRDLVERTIEAAASQPVDPHWPGVAEPHEAPAPPHHATATAEAAPETRAEIVKAFVDAGDGLHAAGYVDTETNVVAIATSAGQRVTTAGTRATVDGIHQTDTSAGSGHQTSDSIDDLDGGTAGARAADLARRSASFVDVEPGQFEVVLSPEAVGTIGVMLAAYGFNAKSAIEQASFVHVGEQQFDARIRLVDDVTDPRHVGLTVDAEGTPKQQLVLVDGGVSRALAHDRRTAGRMGATSTGHRMSLIGESIGPVPLGLAFDGGDADPDELVADVERGLLVTAFNYCRVLDPRTLVVTGLTRNGTFLVEDGTIVGAVGNLRFTQSFVAALAPGRVQSLGNDARLADSEFGAGYVIAPSMHLASWTFSGNADG